MSTLDASATSVDSSRVNNEGRGLVSRLFEPVDTASIVYFRIVYGMFALWMLFTQMQYGFLDEVLLGPIFHFTYYGFSWVKPWSSGAMHFEYVVLIIAAIFVTIGLAYRFAACVLWLGITHIFLIEKSVYLNHYYLMCLLAFLLIFVPANRAAAVDTLINPKSRSEFVPAWSLWLLRFQLALPYVFGGIAKLETDWLAGASLHSVFLSRQKDSVLAPLISQDWAPLLFSWGGLFLDLGVVPLLLWKRTRVFAFAAATMFHLLNAMLFDIDIFPWFMIAATMMFFPPDWPRRFLKLPTLPTPENWSERSSSPGARKLTVAALAAYAVLQVVLPFRPLLYPGNTNWTEEGHRFAWRMMLRTKLGGVGFYATNVRTGETTMVDPTEYVSSRQVGIMAKDPDMMQEFSQFLASRLSAQTGDDYEIRVMALCSLNGRKPQYLVDPDVDLAKTPRNLSPKSWVMPLTEPLRDVPWDVPLREWMQHVEIPERYRSEKP